MESSALQCQVCHSQPSAHLPFFCPSCARNILYESRVRNAQALVTKESLHRKLSLSFSKEEYLESGNSEVSRTSSLLLGVALERNQTSRTESLIRKEWTNSQCLKAKKELETMKQEMKRVKKALAERRMAQQAARLELAQQQSVLLAPLDSSTRRSEAKWHELRSRTAEVRVFLCKELASLYGLVHKKRRKGSIGRDLYFIGRVPILDLRDLNSASPAQMTAAVGRVAHFVYLAAHYLSLRLPAEIVLPSSTNAYAYILPPISSYKDSVFLSASRGNENSGSIETADIPSRQRLLYLEKPLPDLAISDSRAYSLFVDAVTYLAWDVAWLARTQGLCLGSTCWEDICAIGKTLHTLFGNDPSLSIDDQFLKAEVDAGTRVTKSRLPYPNPPGGERIDLTAPAPNQVPFVSSPGYLSHVSSKDFLAATAQMGGGAEYMRSWLFSNPNKIIEKVKNALANERMGAEWEILEEAEWDTYVDDVTMKRPSS